MSPLTLTYTHNRCISDGMGIGAPLYDTKEKCVILEEDILNDKLKQLLRIDGDNYNTDFKVDGVDVDLTEIKEEIKKENIENEMKRNVEEMKRRISNDEINKKFQKEHEKYIIKLSNLFLNYLDSQERKVSSIKNIKAYFGRRVTAANKEQTLNYLTDIGKIKLNGDVIYMLS